MTTSFRITFTTLHQVWQLLDENGVHKVSRPLIDMMDNLAKSDYSESTFATIKTLVTNEIEAAEHSFLIPYDNLKQLWFLLNNSAYRLVQPYIEVIKSLPDASSDELKFIDHLEIEIAEAQAQTNTTEGNTEALEIEVSEAQAQTNITTEGNTEVQE